MSSDYPTLDFLEESDQEFFEKFKADFRPKIAAAAGSCPGVQVETVDLPLLLQEVKFILEQAGYECESRRDAATEEPFIVTPMRNKDEYADRNPIRIYSTGRCLNFVMPILRINSDDDLSRVARGSQEANLRIDDSQFFTGLNRRAYERMNAFGISELDGVSYQVYTRNEYMPELFSRMQPVYSLDEYMQNTTTMCEELAWSLYEAE